MPLRPATFTPYPAQDRRAAARERYYRALEEARRAKEAYAEAVAQDEMDDEKTKDSASTSAPVEPTSPAPTPVLEPAPAPAPAPVQGTEPEPEQASTAATTTTASSNAFAEWVRANMGVPSVFAPSESDAPASPAPPPVTPAPVSSPATTPRPMREERERRRAALRVTELASSPEPSEGHSPVIASVSSASVPPPTAPVTTPTTQQTAPMQVCMERTPLQQLADAAEAAPPQSPRRPHPASPPSAPASTPAPNRTVTPAPASAPAAALPGPKPKSPSPTPQHIPLFAIPAAPVPGDASSDPLREITTLAQTLAGLKAAFVFPERLDFGLPPSATDPSSTFDVGCRLPVCARNLAVHAYEHALGKILARLEGVGNVRARGVREKRKDAVKDVKDEMERVRREVERRAREAWGR